jgi:outer membrane murein-binding lipoprotein Lpp
MAAAALALAGCSSSDGDEGGDDPKPTATASATPTLDAAAQREACVTAWAQAIQAGQDDIDQEPEACQGLPAGDRLDRYMEGMQQRNQGNRDKIAECVEDPTCTSVPVP